MGSKEFPLVLEVLTKMAGKSATKSGAVSDNSTAVTIKASDAGSDAGAKHSFAPSAAMSETTGSASHSSPKKRRKVNHGKLLLRAARYSPFAQ